MGWVAPRVRAPRAVAVLVVVLALGVALSASTGALGAWTGNGSNSSADDDTNAWAASSADDGSTAWTASSADGESGESSGAVIVCVRSDSSALSAMADDGLSWDTLMSASGSAVAESLGALSDEAASQGSGTPKNGILGSGASAGGGTALSAQSDEQAYTISLVTSDALTTDELLEQMSQRDDVVYAEADATCSLEDEGASTSAASVDADDVIPAGNDYTAYEWGLDNAGIFDSGTSSIDIGNDDGLTGSSDAIVAVIDTGVDDANQNLTGAMATLSARQCSELDCGAHGYNAVAAESDRTDSSDYSAVSHGTHVAGIVGASLAEGCGTEGAASGIGLLSVRTFDKTTGSLKKSDLVRACGWVRAARQDGVRICAVNISIGGSFGASYALNLAYRELVATDVAVITAAGNMFSDNDSTMALCNGTFAGKLVIDAMDADGEKANYSNYGKMTTDLFAPGTDIFSTVGSGSAALNAFANSTDRTRIFAYSGFEADGATIDADRNPFVVHRYDQTAQDGCGALVEKSTEKVLVGSGSLALSSGGTFVTDPMDVSAMASDYGRYIEFHASASGSMSANCDVTVSFRKTDGSFSDETHLAFIDAVGWKTELCKIPDSSDIDLASFQVKITVGSIAEGSLYLDCMGLGTGLDEHRLLSGTSMAAPMATGAYALLASEFPDESAGELTARLLGSAQHSDALSNLSRSGGYLDVHQASTDPAPALQSATAQSNAVVVEGRFFGTSGTTTVGGVEVTPTSRTDTRIELKVPSDLSGMQEIEVTDDSGSTVQSGRIWCDTGQRAAYENLAVPTGATYDYATLGKLTTLQDTVYLVTYEESEPVSVSLYAYDTTAGAWSRKTSVPIASGTMTNSDSMQFCTHNGRLYLLADQNGSASTIWAGLYEYDPGTDSWRTVLQDSDGALANSTLVSFDGRLVALGGSRGDGARTVKEVDPLTGAVAVVGALPLSLSGATAVVSDGTLLVTGGTANDVDAFAKVLATTDLSSFTTYGDWPFSEKGDYAFAPTKDGMTASGIRASDGSSGTWTFSKDDGTWAESDVMLGSAATYCLSACESDDVLYVWGQLGLNSGETFFRSTAIESPSSSHEVLTYLPEAAGSTVESITVTIDGTPYGYTFGPMNVGADGEVVLWLPAGFAQVSITAGGMTHDGFEGRVEEIASSPQVLARRLVPADGNDKETSTTTQQATGLPDTGDHWFLFF